MRSRQATARRRSSSAQMRPVPAEALHQRGVLDRLGDNGFSRRALAGAEDLEIAGDPFGVGSARAREARAPVRYRSWCRRARARQSRPFRPCNQRADKILALRFLHASRPDRCRAFRQAGERRVAIAAWSIDRAALADCLTHHVAERLVGGRDHRGRERAAERAVRPSAPSSSTLSVNCSRSCECSASSSTLKRAATLASNGNWCSSCVQKAWMVCTFRPPGRVERLREQPPRMRAAPRIRAVAFELREWPCRGRRRRAWSIRRACRTHGSPCWRRRPW